jgi:hypothetical protein
VVAAVVVVAVHWHTGSKLSESSVCFLALLFLLHCKSILTHTQQAGEQAGDMIEIGMMGGQHLLVRRTKDGGTARAARAAVLHNKKHWHGCLCLLQEPSRYLVARHTGLYEGSNDNDEHALVCR